MIPPRKVHPAPWHTRPLDVIMACGQEQDVHDEAYGFVLPGLA